MTEYKTLKEIKSIAREVEDVQKEIDNCLFCKVNKEPCNKHGIILKLAKEGRFKRITIDFNPKCNICGEHLSYNIFRRIKFGNSYGYLSYYCNNENCSEYKKENKEYSRIS